MAALQLEYLKELEFIDDYNMYSLAIIVSFVFAFITVDFVSGSNKFFQPPQECRNEPEANQENCLRNFCSTNRNTFVCQAYECRQGNAGDGIIEKLAKLKCIENVCSANPTEPVCQELQICNAKKTSGGLFAFIECIIILFSEK